MSTRQKIITLVSISILVAFSLVVLSMAADYNYVGSAKSNKYHYPNCQWALKIKAENVVTFQLAKEAQEAGYIPCKVYKAPTKD